MEKQNKCKDCKWFDQEKKVNYGECFRYPPQVAISSFDDCRKYIRPVVFEDQGCGEFKKK